MRAIQAATLAEADAPALIAAIDSAAGYPRRGTGGTLATPETWDGTGECPAGWTATAAVVTVDRGIATVSAKAADAECLALIASDSNATPDQKRIAATVFTEKSEAAPVEALPVDALPAEGKP